MLHLPVKYDLMSGRQLDSGLKLCAVEMRLLNKGELYLALQSIHHCVSLKIHAETSNASTVIM